ncbi:MULTISPECIES: hypothetical protein [Rhizobium]|uniref:hypothetical protein n=1 Tax=Rhizobium TaxID=379 RepID=UPI001573F5EA|nr:MULTISPECIES: hypothetical protein [Rhizobium]NTG05692.1 hypothetical protein [Rhizobium rhizogenes]NTG84690.1 hypothetical protein [Rhizobium rhizogenes]NTH10654.1 hypothetical protein [Rhizobium rhizogenes]
MKHEKDVISYSAWFRQQILAGQNSANAGNLIPAGEVEAEFAALREETRSKLDRQLS